MNPEILPDLAARYDVSAEHVTEFRRKGHILLRSIVSSEEAAAYFSVILAAREQFGAE